MSTFSYRKLRGRIIEKFGTYAAFARHLGKTKVTVSNKLSNRSGFTKKDIETWGDALELAVDQYTEYFFT